MTTPVSHHLSPELTPPGGLGRGQIVFLNGATSSGKSTIAKELLTVLEGAWFHMAIDGFRAMRSTTSLRVRREAALQRTVLGFHRAVAGFASVGNNVVLDHLLGEEWRLQDCLEVFRGYDVILVGVHCPLDELERRERQRGNRRIGQAALQLHLVHAHSIYDVEVDTGQQDPEQCALVIKEHLARSRGAARAFDRLRSNGQPPNC